MGHNSKYQHNSFSLLVLIHSSVYLFIYVSRCSWFAIKILSKNRPRRWVNGRTRENRNTANVYFRPGRVPSPKSTELKAFVCKFCLIQQYKEFLCPRSLSFSLSVSLDPFSQCWTYLLNLCILPILPFLIPQPGDM